MVAPAVIAAIIGAAGSLGSGLLANRAANQAAAYNHEVDLLNFYLRQQEREDAIRYADRARREQQLGSTDAMGTRTYFDPVRGWVTELTPEMQELVDMQQAEQRQVLQHDLPMRRSRMDANVQRQGEEDYVAGGLLNEFRNVIREDPDAIRQNIIAAGSHGINKGYDDALGTIFRNSIRTGASNTGRVVESVNRARSDDLEGLFLNARLNSEDIADQRYNNRRGQSANLYNLFAERASRMPDVSYAPQNVEGAANAMLGQFANREQQGIAGGLNARQQRGGEMGFIEPNYGLANTVGSVANSISSGINSVAAQRREDNLTAQLLAYVTNGGQINMNNGGTYNTLLGNVGAF